MKLYAWLWRMIRYAPGICLLHAVLWALMNIGGLLPGYLVARLIGHVQHSSDHAAIVWFVVFMVLYALSQVGGWLWAGYTEITMRFVMSGFIRTNLLRHLLRMPGSEAIPLSIGDTISRFRQDAYDAEDALDWTDEIWMAVLTGFIALGVLASIDLQLTLVTIMPIIIVIVLARLASHRLIVWRDRSSAAAGDVAGTIGDVIGAVPLIQGAAAEDRVMAHFRWVTAARKRAVVIDQMATQALNAVTSSVNATAIGLIMLLGASRLRDGTMSIGDFVLFVAWIGYVITVAQDFVGYLAQYSQATVAFRRMMALIKTSDPYAIVEHQPMYLSGALPEIPQQAGVNAPLQTLDVQGLTFTWPESASGIADVALTLQRGELVVVTGAVGSGKSTLLRALLGLLPGTTGEVRWNGERLTDLAAVMVPPRVGWTAQVPNLFSETIRANLDLGQDVVEEHLARAVHLAVLEPDLASFPDGIETRVGSRGKHLSGGQLQRAAAARMFLRRPELLLIDDLSSALDVQTERLLWDRIAGMDGVTCLAVSHRPAALARADRIIVMKDGRVVDTGRYPDLLQNSDELQRLLQGGAVMAP